MEDYQSTSNYEAQDHQPFSFCVDALRPISGRYIIWLILCLGLSFSVYIVWRGMPISSIRSSLFVYYSVIVVHLVRRVKSGGFRNMLGPDILFVFLYTMFHLGYVTLYALGLIPYVAKIFFFQSSIPKALFIVNVGLIAFLFGYEVMGVRRGKPKEVGPIMVPTGGWHVFGLIMMLVAFLMHIGIIAYLGMGFFQQYGYRAIQNVEKYTGSYSLGIIWRQSVHLMVLGVVVHCVSSALQHRKLFRSKVAFTIIVAFFAVIIMEGDRGPILQVGIPILLVRHYLIKPIRLTVITGLLFAGLVLFAAMGIVRTIVFKPRGMMQEYRYQRERGVVTWMSPFVEMGGSFLVVNIVSHEVPSNEPYWLGSSWKNAAIHVVPFLSGFLTRTGLLRSRACSEWITVTYFGLDAAGKAFTVSAKGYLNFGYPGVFLELMLFGIFIRWLTVKFSQNPSVMWAIIMLGCIGPSLIVIRNEVTLVANVCVRAIVLAVFMNVFLGRGTKELVETEELEIVPYYDT